MTRLVTCGCCGKDVSPLANPCPQCGGTPRKLHSQNWLGIGKWLSIAGLIGIAVRGNAAGPAPFFLVIGCIVAYLSHTSRYHCTP